MAHITSGHEPCSALWPKGENKVSMVLGNHRPCFVVRRSTCCLLWGVWGSRLNLPVAQSFEYWASVSRAHHKSYAYPQVSQRKACVCKGCIGFLKACSCVFYKQASTTIDTSMLCRFRPEPCQAVSSYRSLQAPLRRCIMQLTSSSLASSVREAPGWQT